MTISSKYDPVIDAKNPFPLRLGSSAANISHRSVITQEKSFASILTEKTTGIGRADEAQPQSIPLNKELLFELLVKIKERMDDKLLRLVTDGEDQEGSGALFLGVPSSITTLPIIDQPSNNRQDKQNVDQINTSDDLQNIIDLAANTYGVDRNLIYSVIKVESNFKNQSTSPKGARGLMQLMPNTARELGVQNSFDPRENVMGGTRYLKNLLDRYHGNIELALAAYNWGMGNLEKNPEKLPPETSSYISKIFRYYNEVRA